MEPIAQLTQYWQPANFFVAALRLAWQFETEVILPWELFRGNLVQASTRERHRFLAWNVSLADEPMLSLLYDETAGEVHITRGILQRIWQANVGAEVIEGRETEGWARELVGTVSLAHLDAIPHLLLQACAGTSRLPLTSVETPMPAFSLGELMYVFRPDAETPGQPMRYWPELYAHGWERSHGWAKIKLLESLLRACATADVPSLAELLIDDAEQMPRLLRSLFLNVSLSPWTEFVERVLRLTRYFVDAGLWSPRVEIDFLDWLVLLQFRHLNAYDVVKFHHRGANYPDLLLLDAVLDRLRMQAEHLETRAGRRALRLTCLLRHVYEGHLVPSQPTSPGEAMRVLPGPAVSDRRTRRLFADAPLSQILSPTLRTLLARAFDDLTEVDEQVVLGTALFIDRPLGYGKAPAERDTSPLVAHLVYSARVQAERLRQLRHLAEELASSVPEIAAPVVTGLCAVRDLAHDPRPHASLGDALKVSDDFVVIQTMPDGLRRLLATLGRTAGAGRHALVHFPGADFPRRLTLLSEIERVEVLIPEA